MKSNELYRILDDFLEVDKMPGEFGGLAKSTYVAPAFYNKYMGIMLDNTREIEKVYCVVFPDEITLDTILAMNEENILIFTHHGIEWNPRNKDNPIKPIDEKYYSRLKERGISLYVAHSPLDKNGKYSTAVSLSNALGLDTAGEFCRYTGSNIGVIARAEQKSIEELKVHVETVVGHEAKLWKYGDSHIQHGKVCIVAGGGSYPFVIDEVARLGFNTFVTGSAVPSDMDIIKEFHEIARASQINVIAATHYSTEKFALIAMTDYFRGLGIPCRFIEGRCYLEDYGPGV